MMTRCLVVFLLMLTACQTGPRLDRPKSLLGDEVAMSTERLARICRSDNDCKAFEDPCGNVIPVLKWEYDEFVSKWERDNAGRQVRCKKSARPNGPVVCDEGSCVTRVTL